MARRNTELFQDQMGLFAAPAPVVAPTPAPEPVEVPPPPAPERAVTGVQAAMRPPKASPADIREPEEIADAILGKLHTAVGEIEAMKEELADMRPRQARADGEAWAVFVAFEDVDPGAHEQPPPLLVRAAGRYAAEYEAGRLLKVHERRCFAVMGRLTAGAVPIEAHPRRPAEEPHPANFGDAFCAAMKKQIERSDEEMTITMQATADLMGCTVDELEARLTTQAAEATAEKAARKAENKARHVPAPKQRKGLPDPAAPAEAAAMRKLTARQQELLALVEVDRVSNRVVFTRDEHVPDWAALKQVVEALGGRWLGKTKKIKGGWAFDDDADADAIIAHAKETGEVLDPKLVGFFPTSDEHADRMVALLNIKPGDTVLEPEAGTGAIVRAVRRACPEARVLCIELLQDHRDALEADGFEVLGTDFLGIDPEDIPEIDVVAMNPPFGAGRVEIKHVHHAMRFLRPGGRLGVILPTGVAYRDDAMSKGLRAVFDHHGAVGTDDPKGSFKAAGTMTNTFTTTLTVRS